MPPRPAAPLVNTRVDRNSSRIRHSPPSSILTAALLFLVVVVGGWIRSDQLGSIGLIGDELEDLEIFRDMAQWPNPFAGASARIFALDQARLPFHVTAGVMELAGTPVLPTARAVSVASALLVILLVFFLGRACFDERVGLLAAACQAISIYDIGFSRFGFTTSSSLFVAGYLLSLWCWYRAVTTRQLAWCWSAGIAIGLSMAAKLFGLFTILIVGWWLLGHQSHGADGRLSIEPKSPVARTLLTCNLLILLSFTGLATGRIAPAWKLGLFTAIVVPMVAVHVRCLLREKGTLEQESAAAVGAIIVSLALIYFFLGSPDHLDVQRIGQTFEWLPRWNNASFTHTTPWDFIVILLVRLNFPFNILWLASLIYLLPRRNTTACRLLLVAFAVPFLIVTVSRWKVTWYLMMVFPICYLMIAAAVVRGVSAMWKRPFARAAALAGLLGSSVWYGQQLTSLHPYEEIDGYRLGHAFIGWHQPAFVTFEGIPAIAAWMDAHLPYAAEVACIPILHPVYNEYAFQHLLRYRRNPWILYRAAPSLDEALGAPFVLTSLFSVELTEPLVSAGYQPIKTFWLKDLAYGVLYANPQGAEQLDLRGEASSLNDQ